MVVAFDLHTPARMHTHTHQDSERLRIYFGRRVLNMPKALNSFPSTEKKYCYNYTCYIVIKFYPQSLHTSNFTRQCGITFQNGSFNINSIIYTYIHLNQLK